MLQYFCIIFSICVISNTIHVYPKRGDRATKCVFLELGNQRKAGFQNLTDKTVGYIPGIWTTICQIPALKSDWQARSLPEITCFTNSCLADNKEKLGSCCYNLVFLKECNQLGIGMVRYKQALGLVEELPMNHQLFSPLRRQQDSFTELESFNQRFFTFLEHISATHVFAFQVPCRTAFYPNPRSTSASRHCLLQKNYVISLFSNAYPGGMA